MQLAQFSGILKVKNHKYELVAAEREPSQQLIGQMKRKELLIKNFEDLSFQDIEIGKDELIIPAWNFQEPVVTQTLEKDPDGGIENSEINIFEIRIPNFCYIQLIVFDLSYLPVVAVGTWQVRYQEKNVENALYIFQFFS